MLKIHIPKFYQVKEGQTLRKIAEAFSVAEGKLIADNCLYAPIFAGQILRIPQERGDAYIVQAGDTKELLCGSAENYFRKNGTHIFYIGMRVIL